MKREKATAEKLAQLESLDYKLALWKLEHKTVCTCRRARDRSAVLI
jgi:hypothetical protein